MNFNQVDGSPSYIFHIIVPDEIRLNPLEFMEVLIPDSRFPFGLHELVEQCLTHCDGNTILG